jgi:HEAT repeat-containing protein 5
LEAIASLVDQDSDFVFDALDRRDDLKSPNGTGFKGPEINYRNEPVAFFFVLYGLAFEALVTRPSTNTPDSQDQTLEILVALKKILRPSVAGNAIYQDVVFSETMDVFDRLAQTEGLAVQSAIVEITRNLCLSHPSADEDASDEHLSEDIEQLFELTRIIVLVLAGVLPNLSEKPSAVRSQVSDEAVNLIAISLSALVDAADVFPAIIRTDLHACIIHIFTTILGTGVCQALVVPRILPIFKRFIQNLAEDVEEGETTNGPLSDQLRSCLSRIRAILHNAQRRESDASLQCARNTLLAIVILLTTGGAGIPSSDSSIHLVLSDLLDCLSDIGLGKVAANCSRSLLLADQKSATGQSIAAYLLPRLIHFIIDNEQADPDGAKPIALNALLSFLATLPPNTDRRTSLVCILLPILLQRTATTGKEAYPEMASRLLAIAGVDQMAFRSVVGSLSPEQRALMEEIIRAGGFGQGDSRARNQNREEPTIALKLKFG